MAESGRRSARNAACVRRTRGIRTGRPEGVLQQPCRNVVELLERRIFLSDGPDLTVSFGLRAPLYPAYVPGDSVKLPVTIQNIGNGPAVGTSAAPITVDIRASLNSTYDASDFSFARLKITSVIAEGATLTRTVTIKVPPEAPAGNYYVVAKVDAASAITETNESNNTAASPTPVPVIWQAGEVTGRPAVKSLQFVDADGTLVALRLSGAGTATVNYSTGSFDIAVTGSTSASKLTLATAKATTPGNDGRFSLRSLTVGNPADAGDHTSIGSITGITTDVDGDIGITGSATTIKLGNIAGGHRVNIGSPLVAPRVAPSVSLTFAAVENLTINSTIGIKLLQVADWQDTDGTKDCVTAPWIAKLAVTGSKTRPLTGDFETGVHLTASSGATPTAPTFGSASVAGSVTGHVWDCGGNAGKISMGVMAGDFVANFSGTVAGLTVKGNADGKVSARSIASLSVGGNMTGARILAGADMGSDAALGGSAAAADSFGPGYIGKIAVAGSVTGSTILAGVDPFDGKFNDLNDVAVGGKSSYIGSISISGSVDSTSRFDGGMIPSTAKIGGLSVPTQLDGRFGQNRFALTDAGMTDANGRITLDIAGQPQAFELLDEATGRPLADVGVAVSVDAESHSFGVMTIVSPDRSLPIDFIYIQGTATPASPAIAMSAMAAPMAATGDTATLLLSDMTTKTVLSWGTDKLTQRVFDTGDTALRDAINSEVGFLASAFTSLISIGIHGLDNVSHGAVSDYISRLPLASNETMTPEEAKARILTNRATDVAGTLMLAGMTRTLDPLTPAATLIDLSSDGVAWGVADMAEDLPGMEVRVTSILGMDIYSYAPIPTWKRNATAGLVNVQVPTAADAENGFLELISKSNPGESFVKPLNSAGNASISVPVGSYLVVAHAADHAPGQETLTVAAGTNPVTVDLDEVPRPDILVAPVAGLQTSESGGTATFAVALATEPAANVTIALSCSDATEGKLSKTSLVFTPANWDTPQVVVITGVNDSVVDSAVAYTIVTQPAVSADPAYSGLNPPDVSVTNLDDESPSIAIDDAYVAETLRQWIPSFGGGSWQERFRIVCTATASGPVGTYLFTYPGNMGTLAMDSWTGTGGGYNWRESGDPATTQFTFSVYTDWQFVSSAPYPDFTVQVEAYYGTVDPAISVTDSRVIVLPMPA